MTGTTSWSGSVTSKEDLSSGDAWSTLSSDGRSEDEDGSEQSEDLGVHFWYACMLRGTSRLARPLREEGVEDKRVVVRPLLRWLRG